MTDKLSHEELNTQLKFLQWYKYLSDTNNVNFMPLFADTSRYLVLKGGGGSGKSVFAARKIVERCVSERDHRFLVVRKVGKTIRQSCFRLILGHLMEYYPDVQYKSNQTDMVITFPDTNSEILFSGIDDPEKLKSIYNITGIWIEEASELLESDFNQLDIRLRGETRYYKQIIITFNPISILHWLKQRFFDRKVENATVHESTYKDNRFLDAENIKVLEGYKDTDEYYYMVYCLGEWGVTGKTVFDAKKVSQRVMDIIRESPLLRSGYFEATADHGMISDWDFVTDEKGFVSIYKEPEEGGVYVIGADTAGGGSDACVAQVVNAKTLEQVATLRDQNLNEDVFAWQLYCLGKFYNNALIAVEVNWSTYPILELERLKYPKQYVREVFDDALHKIQLKYGFRTDTKTRPVIISNLVQFVREHTELLNDKTTLQEMLTFIRNPETFKPEAEEGAHDDTVMAMAIAMFVLDSGQVRSDPIEEDESAVVWTDDMYEDYYNAGAEDRRLLMERWGKPKDL